MAPPQQSHPVPAPPPKQPAPVVLQPDRGGEDEHAAAMAARARGAAREALEAPLRRPAHTGGAIAIGGEGGRTRYQSRCMATEEIDQILRIQWAATHPTDRPAYEHDYYMQAWLAKNLPTALKEPLRPRALRGLQDADKAGRDAIAFVQLDGLGRVPFSNLKTPKPLLDVSAPTPVAHGDDDEDVPAKPLELEPMLAARQMMEDGLCVLLDIDDVDRLLAASPAKDERKLLIERRNLLVDTFGATLRLSKTPEMMGGEGATDLVFQRITCLPKGRVLLARFMPVAGQNEALVARMVWAVFRNLRALFTPAADGPPEGCKGAGAIADATVQAVRRLKRPEHVCGCLVAVAAGAATAAAASGSTPAEGGRPPLANTGQAHGAVRVLEAVLVRAQELGLGAAPGDDGADKGKGAAVSEETGQLWQGAFAAFFMLLNAHLGAVVAARKTVSGAAVQTLLEQAVPLAILNALMAHATSAQQEQLRESVMALN